MVNSAGIYLELDGAMLLLCDARWGLVPIGVGIPDFETLPDRLNILLGDPVSCGPDGLQFPGGWIKIEQIQLPPWEYAPVKEAAFRAGILALGERTRGLAPLAETLLAGKSLPENNPLLTLACPRLEKLLAGMEKKEVSVVTEAAVSLLGLGPGLTPSADDVLCGFVYGLLRSSQGENTALQALISAICREAEGRTHPVSAAYLKAIGEGESFQRLEEAWLALTGRAEPNFEKILEVGSSSGGDLLLGLLLAGKLCMEREETAYGGSDRTGFVG